MLLQKIWTSRILICSGFLLVSCSKNYEPQFFNGEWLSDSLVTKENDHWREFLYFDHGQAARTTAWGKQYLLNKNLRIKGLKLYNHDKPLFQIKVIDSNKIIVEGKDYYGSFYRSNFQITDMKTAVSTSERTEKERKKLIGKWNVVGFKTVPLSGKHEDKIMATLMQDEKLADIPFKEIKSVYYNYKTFSIQTQKKMTDFEYSAELDRIDFSSGDIAISIKYYFQKDHLIIESPTAFSFLNILTLEKTL